MLLDTAPAVRSLRARDAPEADVAGSAAHPVPLAGRGPVPVAVGRCAQMGAALGDATVGLGQPRVDLGSAAGMVTVRRGLRGRRARGLARGTRLLGPRAARPLPDVAGDVVEAEPVGREAP